ncbi:aminopeptidase P family N-terminal domain-containing protein [Mesorhizobium sp. M0859]|uniref:aminopeptidase P family N-terminal domain-containing protein n=1 Tax=Mesorhizobium sp. M0859 TaxID=2957014 RepID=UPI00333D014A
MTGFVDRERATDLMQRAGIEALVLCEPEAFQYATGAWIGPAGLFRRAGAGFVVIPKRGDLPIGVVVADFQAARLRAAMAGACCARMRSGSNRRRSSRRRLTGLLRSASRPAWLAALPVFHVRRPLSLPAPSAS